MAKEQHAYSLMFNEARELSELDQQEFKMYFDSISSWYAGIVSDYNFASKNN
jgi:hypothetical protein